MEYPDSVCQGPCAIGVLPQKTGPYFENEALQGEISCDSGMGFYLIRLLGFRSGSRLDSNAGPGNASERGVLGGQGFGTGF